MNFKNCGLLKAFDPRVGQVVYLASSIVTNYALVRLRLTVLLTPRALEKSFDPVQAALGARPYCVFSCGDFKNGRPDHSPPARGRQREGRRCYLVQTRRLNRFPNAL